MYYIYALFDPIKRVPFYIGKGKGNRAYSHLNNRDKCNQRKIARIAEIRSSGVEPEVHFIAEEIEDEKIAYAIEYAMIQQAKPFFNIELTNRVGIDLRPPSRLGASMPESAKMAISIAVKNRPKTKKTEEQKRTLSVALKGKKKPPRTEVHKSNIGKSKAKSYIVIFPNGEQTTITNMASFCNDHKLCRFKMYSVAAGQRTHHRNFKVCSTSQNSNLHK
jgi:hypothetical protein